MPAQPPLELHKPPAEGVPNFRFQRHRGWSELRIPPAAPHLSKTYRRYSPLKHGVAGIPGSPDLLLLRLVGAAVVLRLSIGDSAEALSRASERDTFYAPPARPM